MRNNIISYSLGLWISLPAVALAQPAFPGAQGFGAAATGGRGGEVLKVTSLAADPLTPGTLAYAAARSGPRIVVFDVSGVIEGDVEITSGDITIAGQTAPGAGITLLGHLYTPYGEDVSNIVVRHLRVRPPAPDGDWPPEQHDAIQFSTARLILLDHVDVSHGADENVDFWGGASDITVQWSTLTFARIGAGHPDGDHNFCLINSDGGSGGEQGGRISVHHNLFAHCRSRTPALGMGPAEVVNNVVYNPREGFVHHNAAYGDFNIMGNSYLDGPSEDLSPFWFDPENDAPPTRYHLEANRIDDPGVFTGEIDNPFDADGFSDAYGFYDDSVLEPSQFDYDAAFDFSSESGHVSVTVDSPTAAYESVLAHAGTCPRDWVTLRAVDEVEAKEGAYATLPLEDLLQGLSPTAAPQDGDSDGLPDAWEGGHGLNASNGADHNTVLASGYTAIEQYVNELSDALCDMPPSTDTGQDTTPDTATDEPTATGSETHDPTSTDSGADSASTDTATAEPKASSGNDGCSCRVIADSSGPLPLFAWLLALE